MGNCFSESEHETVERLKRQHRENYTESCRVLAREDDQVTMKAYMDLLVESKAIDVDETREIEDELKRTDSSQAMRRGELLSPSSGGGAISDVAAPTTGSSSSGGTESTQPHQPTALTVIHRREMELARNIQLLSNPEKLDFGNASLHTLAGSSSSLSRNPTPAQQLAPEQQQLVEEVSSISPSMMSSSVRSVKSILRGSSLHSLQQAHPVGLGSSTGQLGLSSSNQGFGFSSTTSAIQGGAGVAPLCASCRSTKNAAENQQQVQQMARGSVDCPPTLTGSSRSQSFDTSSQQSSSTSHHREDSQSAGAAGLLVLRQNSDGENSPGRKIPTVAPSHPRPPGASVMRRSYNHAPAYSPLGEAPIPDYEWQSSSTSTIPLSPSALRHEIVLPPPLHNSPAAGMVVDMDSMFLSGASAGGGLAPGDSPGTSLAGPQFSTNSSSFRSRQASSQQQVHNNNSTILPLPPGHVGLQASSSALSGLDQSLSVAEEIHMPHIPSVAAATTAVGQEGHETLARSPMVGGSFGPSGSVRSGSNSIHHSFAAGEGAGGQSVRASTMSASSSSSFRNGSSDVSQESQQQLGWLPPKPASERKDGPLAESESQRASIVTDATEPEEGSLLQQFPHLRGLTNTTASPPQRQQHGDEEARASITNSVVLLEEGGVDGPKSDAAPTISSATPTSRLPTEKSGDQKKETRCAQCGKQLVDTATIPPTGQLSNGNKLEKRVCFGKEEPSASKVAATSKHIRRNKKR